jgi:hypothetical protein
MNICICVGGLSVDIHVYNLLSPVFMFSYESKNAVARLNLPVTLNLIITSFYYNLLIY